jgi:hypothetical protein
MVRCCLRQDRNAGAAVDRRSTAIAPLRRTEFVRADLIREAYHDGIVNREVGHLSAGTNAPGGIIRGST